MTDEQAKNAPSLRTHILAATREFSLYLPKPLEPGDCDELMHILEPVVTTLLAARERAVWEAAVKLTCPMCANGYPLQKNGGWHNDMNGNDTLVNAMCHGTKFRQQAEEE